MSTPPQDSPKKSSLMPVVYIVAVLCFMASIKGWATFMLVPSLLVVVPALVVVNTAAWKIEHLPGMHFVRTLRKSQLALTLAAYASVPAFGDTKDVLLFGFIPAQTGDLATRVITSIMMALAVLAITAFVALLISIVYARKRTR